jgi:hypothetical protein
MLSVRRDLSCATRLSELPAAADAINNAAAQTDSVDDFVKTSLRVRPTLMLIGFGRRASSTGAPSVLLEWSSCRLPSRF